jgi:hypothetical protein
VPAKVRLLGVRLTPGTAPVPLKLTVWGLAPPLSAIDNEAVREPVAPGVKVMPMLQLELAATEEPQVLVVML